jgi:transposase
MNKNKNLHSAKREKNDEFYTMYEDIEKEVFKYKDYFKGKVIFCNCDDPVESNFVRYFALNFRQFGLKKIISTHYENDKPSYKLIIDKDITGDGIVDINDAYKVELEQNGDFRSPECVSILDEYGDDLVVVTNPPFSLFREYIQVLMEHNTKFLVIGNGNAITYKEVFKYIKENRLWLGYTYPTNFLIDKPERFAKYCSDKNKVTVNGRDFWSVNISVGTPTYWFTNLPVKKREEDLILYKKYYSVLDGYNPETGENPNYPKYDNYDAINVDKVKEIPLDYDGVIGVPITFLKHYCPTQFSIEKFRKGDDEKDLTYTKAADGREREREFNHISEYSSGESGDLESSGLSQRWQQELYNQREISLRKDSHTESVGCFHIIGKMSTTKIEDLEKGYPYINGVKKYARILIQKVK